WPPRRTPRGRPRAACRRIATAEQDRLCFALPSHDRRTPMTTRILLVTLLAHATSAGAQRLPGGIVPSHYQLTLTPDLAGGRFTGEERIRVDLGKPTGTITLNAKEL